MGVHLISSAQKSLCYANLITYSCHETLNVEVI